MANACSNHLLGGVAEALFREAHALGELAEEPHVGARFAERFDGLVGELHKIVAVCALDVGVLEERGCGQDILGEIGRIGEELVVDYREEVRALKAAHHGIMVGRYGARVGVVHEERMNIGSSADFVSWSLPCSLLFQRLTQGRHIHGACRALER